MSVTNATNIIDIDSIPQTFIPTENQKSFIGSAFTLMTSIINNLAFPPLWLIKFENFVFYDQSRLALFILHEKDPTLTNVLTNGETKRKIDVIKQKVGVDRNIQIYQGNIDLLIGGIQSRLDPLICFNPRDYSQNLQDFLLTKQIIHIKTNDQVVLYNSATSMALSGLITMIAIAALLGACVFDMPNTILLPMAGMLSISYLFGMISSLNFLSNLYHLGNKNTLKNDELAAKIHGLDSAIDALAELKTKEYSPSSIFEPSIDTRIQHLLTLKA